MELRNERFFCALHEMVWKAASREYLNCCVVALKYAIC